MLRNKNSQKYSDLHPKRKIYSQNFLKDKSLIYDLVNDSGINKNDIVLEIGAGKGIITKFLLQFAKKVIAIEIDEELIPKLKEKFSEAENFELIKQDINKFNLPDYKYKVFSNIPFNITSDILNKLLDYKKGPEEAYLIVQMEAAKRFIGNPMIRETLVSLLNKPFFQIEIFHEFLPSDFDPAPNVKAVMIHIKKREKPLIELENTEIYEDFLTYSFINQNERLSNALKEIFTYKQFTIMSKNLKFDIKANASELNSEQWLGLFENFLTRVEPSKKNIVKAFKIKFDYSKKN